MAGAAGGGAHLVSEPLHRAHRIERAVADVRARGRRRSRRAGRMAAGVDGTPDPLGGFSQGACLALEFVAAHPARYGGVAGLSGGLIGPPGTDVAHGRFTRRHARVPGMQRRGLPHPQGTRAGVRGSPDRSGRPGHRRSLYPNMDHTVNEDELRTCRSWWTGFSDGPARQFKHPTASAPRADVACPLQ